MKRKNKIIRKGNLWQKGIVYALIVVYLILVLLPFVILICGSFSSSDAIKDVGARPWIQGFTLEAYKMVFENPNEILKSYGITIFITVAGTVLNLILCSMSAYALARPNFRYKGIIAFFYAFTVMFQAGFIPTYIWYRNYLHIYNTYTVLILFPCFTIGHVVMLRAFYGGLPQSLYEAAKIDGASEFKSFLTIATPLIIPGLATVAFYSVLIYWNDPFTAMLYTDDIVPISLYLTRLQNYVQLLKEALAGKIAGVDATNLKIPENTLVFAMAVVSSAPIMCVFAFFQKYFVSGLTAGSIKE